MGEISSPPFRHISLIRISAFLRLNNRSGTRKGSGREKPFSMLIFSQRATAPSYWPQATMAPFIAPTEVPTTQVMGISNSRMARQAPIW